MRPDGWRLVERDGLTIASCDALAEDGRFGHGFSTRLDGGKDGFDLGAAGDRSPAVAARRGRFLAACGLGGGLPFVLEQVHGAAVVVARADATTPEADAARWEPGRSGRAIPCVRTADCVPILVVDRRRGAVAAIHAGWRGTAAGIVGAAVRAMAAEGSEPSDLVAALGPAIGACCYETGEDVAGAVAAASGGEGLVRPAGGGRPHVDLRAANGRQLLDASLPSAALHVAPWCTRCRVDLFYSFRGEGPAAGRAMAAVGPAGLA